MRVLLDSITSLQSLSDNAEVYEIVSRQEPHYDKEPNEAAIAIRDNFLTPAIPSDCPEKIRELMKMCWHKVPEERPTFENICKFLER